MKGTFEIVFKVDEDNNSETDIGMLNTAADLVDDACDCGSKGMILCQVYRSKCGTRFMAQGKFLNKDIASEIITLTKKLDT